MPSFFSPPCGRCLGAGKVFLDCGCNLSWHSPGPTNSRTAIVLEDLKSIQNHLWVKRVCYCNRVAWCCVFPTGLFEGNLHLWDIPEAGSDHLAKLLRDELWSNFGFVSVITLAAFGTHRSVIGRSIAVILSDLFLAFTVWPRCPCRALWRTRLCCLAVLMICKILYFCA